MPKTVKNRRMPAKPQLDEQYVESLVNAVKLLNEGNYPEAIESLTACGDSWTKDPDGVLVMMYILDAIGQSGVDDVAEETAGISKMFLDMSYGKDRSRYPSSGLLQKNHPEPQHALSAVNILVSEPGLTDEDKRLLLDVCSRQDVYEYDTAALATGGFLSFDIGDYDRSIRCLSAYVDMENSWACGEPQEEAAEEDDYFDGIRMNFFRRSLMVLSMALFASKDYEGGMKYAEMARALGVGIHSDAPVTVFMDEEPGTEDELQDMAEPEGIAVASGGGLNDCMEQMGADAISRSGLIPEQKTGSVNLGLARTEGAASPSPSASDMGKAAGNNPKVFFSVALLPDGSFQKIISK